MPTKREREYYQMGFRDGYREGHEYATVGVRQPHPVKEKYYREGTRIGDVFQEPKPKRKLSAWNKFVKANSKKPRFVLRSGKLNLKKMGVAFRKTPLGKKKR